MRRLSCYFFCSLVFYSAYAEAEEYRVNSNSDEGVGSLRQAILDLNKTGSFLDNTITIDPSLQAIDVASDLPVIQKNVSIVAKGAVPQVIDGQNRNRLFAAFAKISIENCVLKNGLALGEGGAPGHGFSGGGGGGLGAGGAVYIEKDYALTLKNVSITGNRAYGGVGGPGEMGDGILMGGQGGSSSFALAYKEALGTVDISKESGRGGVGGSREDEPGRGAFGGGGGGGSGSHVDGSGKEGGFGAGGGGGAAYMNPADGGAGGFLGGKGGAGQPGGCGSGGGGGAGIGGGVFIGESALLTIRDNVFLSNNVVQGGQGGLAGISEASGRDGGGYAQDVFLYKGGRLVFDLATVLDVDFSIQSFPGSDYRDGGIVKAGPGLLTFSSLSNNYQGGTEIKGGILAISNNENLGEASGKVTLDGGGVLRIKDSLIMNRDINLAGLGILEVLSNQAVTLSGSIAGSGSLEKWGEGSAIFSGVGSYTGETVVREGVLKAGGKNVFSPHSHINLSSLLPDRSIALDLNGFDQTFGNLSSSYAGVVTSSGEGAVTLTVGDEGDGIFRGIIEDGQGIVTLAKCGKGVLKLTGSNTYKGGTLVKEGSLEGDATSLQGDIGNEGVVVFDQGAKGLYPGALSGSGSVVKKNEGLLIFTGANQYQGGTLVLDGVLKGNTVSLQGDIDNRADVVFDQESEGVYSGVIFGSGRLIKQNVGTLRLEGLNSYQGGTVITEGVLEGNAQSLQGDIENRGEVVFEQEADGVYLGSMFGSGRLIKRGDGKLSLKGVNRYEKGSVVFSGVLEGDAISLQGDIVNHGVVVFDQVLNDTYAGSISGRGKFVKTGRGVLTLEGDHDYAGGTVIGGGVLRIGTLHTLPSSGIVDLAVPGACLDLNNFDTTIRFLSGASGSVITNNSSGNVTLTIEGEENQGFSGSIRDGDGVIKLVKKGGGILTLGGINGYTGGSVVAQGTLQSDAKNLSGDIENNGTVLFDQPYDGEYEGRISGSGNMIKRNAGVLTLTNQHSYTGSTTIAEGRLKLGVADALLSSERVELFEGATLDLNQFDQTFSDLKGAEGTTITSSAFNGAQETATLTVKTMHRQIISGVIEDGEGCLALAKEGKGSLRLNGLNRYTGGTRIGDGKLKLGGAHTLPVGGSVELSSKTAILDLNNFKQTIGVLKGVPDSIVTSNAPGMAILEVGNETNQVFYGTIVDKRGVVSLVKQGAGALTLAGVNKYTGGTVVEQGVLRGDAESLQGSIDNQATVVFDQEIDGIYRGVVTGKGDLVKGGGGKLTVVGKNEYTGGTTVIGGGVARRYRKFAGGYF